MSGAWVFGYGSLVSPVSFGHTLGREPRFGTDMFEAEVDGYGRRWNYATSFTFTAAVRSGSAPQELTAVALGVAPADGETVNGVVAWVDGSEIAALDLREQYYDRVDVTDRAMVVGDIARGSRIVTYVPQPVAVRNYEAARDRGAAAVTKRYWELVDGAFADLGPDRHERYHRTTPRPSVPIVDVPIDQLPDRHRIVRR